MKLRSESSYSDQNLIRIMTCTLGLPSRTFSSPPITWSSGVVEGWSEENKCDAVVEKSGMIYGIWIGSGTSLQNVWQENVLHVIYNFTTPLFLFLLSFLSLPFVDPMGEEHYARGAPWIPPFMVVVSPIRFLYFVCKIISISIWTDHFLYYQCSDMLS